ncbi:GNAT family N-acetyltransferase [Streptomyces sp. CA-179760]|uniref:GNAT family N-acetyltransferase n=1 Tax=Streptomyces sp. CA-179760 TaxID=3240054 RepID=UPI003D92A787
MDSRAREGPWTAVHRGGHDRPVRRETVTLSKIVPDDWAAVHTWAGLSEACRYQPWGPNTPDETREFVAGAVAAWSDSPQRRFPYVARLGPDVVGMGELRVRGDSRRQPAAGRDLLHRASARVGAGRRDRDRAAASRARLRRDAAASRPCHL